MLWPTPCIVVVRYVLARSRFVFQQSLRCNSEICVSCRCCSWVSISPFNTQDCTQGICLMCVPRHGRKCCACEKLQALAAVCQQGVDHMTWGGLRECTATPGGAKQELQDCLCEWRVTVLQCRHVCSHLNDDQKRKNCITAFGPAQQVTVFHCRHVYKSFG